ncbi:MAG: copper chaperone CopZ [Flavobacterium sp.]|jgi:copper chaperone CopZ
MKSLKTIVSAIILLLSAAVSNAQIKNSKSANVKILGNCGMCETNIEKAGNLKKIATVDWNKDTQTAAITYDSKQTTQDEILKRIALAGYDSEFFLAPDDVYDNLHGCCQYVRETKVESSNTESASMENHDNHNDHASYAVTKTKQEVNQLIAVFDNYFLLKDALVKTDGKVASLVSKDLLASLNAVKMDQLQMDEHMVWMKVMKQLKEDAEHVSDTQDVQHQRDHFMTMSKSMYELMKISKSETPTFYQFCPMANGGKGANWLSKDSVVKNPYYGAKMLSCGKTVETLK